MNSQQRDPRVDPKPGDVLCYRDQQAREVTVTFIDAAGTAQVWYKVPKLVTRKQWRLWAKNAEVIHAAE